MIKKYVFTVISLTVTVLLSNTEYKILDKNQCYYFLAGLVGLMMS